jgi:hypothetical protein
MGGFYTNVTVRHDNPADVAGALERLERTAFLSPVVNGCCVVFDEATEDQDVAEMERLAQPLSKRLRCAALAVLIHDDALLYYVLFESGRMTDEYNSRPGFEDGSERSPEGGVARALAAAFDAHDRAGEVERVLHRSEYALATERHAQLVAALGLPEFAVATGYDGILEGRVPPGLSAGRLWAVGGAPVVGEPPSPVLPDLTPEEAAALEARLGALVRPSPELAAVIGASPLPYHGVIVKVIGSPCQRHVNSFQEYLVFAGSSVARCQGPSSTFTSTERSGVPSLSTKPST